MGPETEHLLDYIPSSAQLSSRSTVPAPVLRYLTWLQLALTPYALPFKAAHFLAASPFPFRALHLLILLSRSEWVSFDLWAQFGPLLAFCK